VGIERIKKTSVAFFGAAAKAGQQNAFRAMPGGL
jgi:hypothetical protein